MFLCTYCVRTYTWICVSMCIRRSKLQVRDPKSRNDRVVYVYIYTWGCMFLCVYTYMNMRMCVHMQVEIAGARPKGAQ